MNERRGAPALLCLLLILLHLGFLHAHQRLLWTSTSARPSLRRDRIADVHRHLQALKHFNVARHAASLELTDAALLVGRCKGGPVVVKLRLCALLIGHAALVVLRY